MQRSLSTSQFPNGQRFRSHYVVLCCTHTPQMHLWCLFGGLRANLLIMLHAVFLCRRTLCTEDMISRKAEGNDDAPRTIHGGVHIPHVVCRELRMQALRSAARQPSFRTPEFPDLSQDC